MKKRRKKSAAARMRPFWIPILVLACAAAVGGYYAASWPGFELKAVAVRGNAVVATGEIERRAALPSRGNIWLQSMGAAAARVRAIPYIADVHVHRTLPAGVTIAVTERKPFAVVETSPAPVLVDRDGRVLEAAAPRRGGVPQFVVPRAAPKPGAYVRDPRFAELVSDYDALLAAHVPASRLWFDKLGDLNALLPGGVLAKLGDDSTLGDKAPLIAPVLAQTQRSGRRVRAVDLRAPKTPVVVYQ